MVLHGSVAVRESQEGTFLGSGFVLDGLRRDEENSDPFWTGCCQRAGSPAAGCLTGTSVISVAEAGVTGKRAAVTEKEGWEIRCSLCLRSSVQDLPAVGTTLCSVRINAICSSASKSSVKI